jgi:hypothetical protein
MTPLSRPLEEIQSTVRPFVGARLRGDLTRCIDILHSLGNARRADVRRATREGVFVHFYGRDELIPWTDIYEVTVSALDERGNRINSITIEHVAEGCVLGRAA